MSAIWIFDMDGVIANIDHRLHHIYKDNPDWDAFFSDSELLRDSVIPATRTIMDGLESQKIFPIILTSRTENTRIATASWLARVGVKYSELIMKPENTHDLSSPAWKKSILENLVEAFGAPAYFFDDSLENVEAANTVEGVTAITYAATGVRTERMYD